jgi:hypothetical protein
MTMERRIPRVPFVRPCSLLLDDGLQASACLVNLSVLGAYVSHEDPFASAARLPPLPPDLPRLGQLVRVQFVLQEGGTAVAIDGRVSWLNPRQQHPVHSLPPGFGLQFQPLPEPVRAAVETAVNAWLEAHPGAR